MIEYRLIKKIKLFGNSISCQFGGEYVLCLQTTGDGNETTSTISLSVELEDEGVTLSCRASNSHIPGSAIEDSWTLTVHCKF